MVLVTAERKAFSLQWTGVEGRSLVAFTEKSKKKVVRGFLLKEGATWLARVLKTFAEKSSMRPEGEVAEERRWRDHQCTMLAGAHVNPKDFTVW